jgi:hypothetical protein
VFCANEEKQARPCRFGGVRVDYPSIFATVGAANGIPNKTVRSQSLAYRCGRASDAVGSPRVPYVQASDQLLLRDCAPCPCQLPHSLVHDVGGFRAGYEKKDIPCSRVRLAKWASLLPRYPETIISRANLQRTVTLPYPLQDVSDSQRYTDVACDNINKTRCDFITTIKVTVDAQGNRRTQRVREQKDCESTTCRTSARYVAPTNTSTSSSG